MVSWWSNWSRNILLYLGRNSYVTGDIVINIFYSEQKDQIFEWYDNDPDNFYANGFRYSSRSFLGESITLIDQFGKTTYQPHRMPFGKHKGELVEGLSDNYLRWVGSIANGPLKFWIDEEMIKRFGQVLGPESRGLSYSYSGPKSRDAYDWDDTEASGISMWDFGDND